MYATSFPIITPCNNSKLINIPSHRLTNVSLVPVLLPNLFSYMFNSKVNIFNQSKPKPITKFTFMNKKPRNNKHTLPFKTLYKSTQINSPKYNHNQSHVHQINTLLGRIKTSNKNSDFIHVLPK